MDVLDFPGFYNTPSKWRQARETRPYQHQIQRAWTAFEPSAVFCIEGRPTVYFREVARADPKLEAEWQKHLWNLGTATMLVVEDPINTRVYSALAKPRPQPIEVEVDDEVQLADDDRLVARLETTVLALELRQFLLSVQTGQFYRDFSRSFRAEAAIDQYLLDQLTAARDRMLSVDGKSGALDDKTVHAFLGRCLLACYLVERGVIGERQLVEVNMPPAENLRGVLEQIESDTKAVQALFRLFRLLDDDFNGSLFGSEFAGQQQLFTSDHISILRQFLAGTDLKSAQPVLPGLDLYEFKYIPIELISAIYERFVAGAEQKDAAGQDTSRQRKSGIYYTPPRLAELVVDIATRGWDTLLGKRYLDPACGSGVFLVLLFQRIAAEWRWRNPKARNLTRARALRNILTDSLCGVDVDGTACLIACFSLYLAFLDQLEPNDIWALKESLRSEEGKVLPPLHVRTVPATDASCVLEANFFGIAPDALGQFDLVIGNPPWTGRNQEIDAAMRQWLFDARRNPSLAEVSRKTTERNQTLLPAKQSATAFLWKTPLHVNESGGICLLLPSRMLLSNQSDKFQAAWFQRFRVDEVWQLADFRFILCKEADCPAIVVKAGSDRPDAATAEIASYTPKVEQVDPRQASIVVSADDRKSLPLADLLTAAANDRAFMFWKVPFWGTGRDRRLIERLQRMPTLGKLAGKPHEGKRWVKGQGLKPWRKASYDGDPKKYGEPKLRWWNDDALFLDARKKSWGVIVLEDDCSEIGSEPSKLHRLPDKQVFSRPMVLVNQGCSRFAFCEFDVLFQHSLQSISGPADDADLLLLLTAVLNSPLATYYLFHTSANWGVERDKVHFEELLQLPFPLPERTKDAVVSRDLVRQIAARLRQARAEMSAGGINPDKRDAARQRAIRETNELVYRYYDLTEWERWLVEDTVNIFEPSATPGSLNSKQLCTLKPSGLDDRRVYADLLCGTISRWAQQSPYLLSGTTVLAEQEGVALLTLTKVPRGKPAAEYHELEPTPELRRLVERVARASVREGLGGLRFLRGFALFDELQVHILKPLALHHWTRTAALNDADELALYIANMGQSG